MPLQGSLFGPGFRLDFSTLRLVRAWLRVMLLGVVWAVLRLGFFWFWVWGLASLGIVCAWFRVDFFKVGPPLMLETAKIAQADLCTFCMNGGFDSCKKTGLTSSGFRQVWFRASLIWGLLGLSQRLFLLSFKA